MSNLNFGLQLVAILAFLVIILSGCASSPAAPEPIVITKDVDKIVRVKCSDERPAPPDYPDTDERLAQIPDDDIFGLAKAFRAGRDLRIARLAADDAQIKACAGG